MNTASLCNGYQTTLSLTKVPAPVTDCDCFQLLMFNLSDKDSRSHTNCTLHWLATSRRVQITDFFWCWKTMLLTAAFVDLLPPTTCVIVQYRVGDNQTPACVLHCALEPSHACRRCLLVHYFQRTFVSALLNEGQTNLRYIRFTHPFNAWKHEAEHTSEVWA